MKNIPLVSVIIISYKNYKYIYQAINSVLSQNYQNIELIISNDGSKDFKKDTVINYLKKNCQKNIKKHFVNDNKKNLGTVKNINNALKQSTGKYILIFAADDIMYNNKVVSNFIKAFNTLPKKELIVTSQIGMYDIKLKKLIEKFVSQENINKIRNLSPEELFGEISLSCIIPGVGTCYKKKIFEKYGLFDEKYTLIEDYSSSLRYSRLGIKFNFINFTSFKHRDGGISHGNLIGDTSSHNKYELDIINIMKHEIMPFIKILNFDQKTAVIKLYKDRKWRYEYNHRYQSESKKERRLFVIENLDIIITTILKDIFHKLNDKSTVLAAFGIIMYTTYSLNFDYGSGIISTLNLKKSALLINNINHFIGLTGLIIILLCLSIKILIILRVFNRKLIKFIRHII